MKEVLGNEFTESLEKIWILVMQNIVATMMEEVKDLKSKYLVPDSNTEFDIYVVQNVWDRIYSRGNDEFANCLF